MEQERPFKKIAVTNRKLCKRDGLSEEESLLLQIEKLCQSDYDFIILREKDLSKEQYQGLAMQALDICRKKGQTLLLHTYTEVAQALGCDGIHLPLPNLKPSLPFSHIGASIHSPEDARLAETLGATYLLAGHVFDTDCKKGLSGRGIPWLKRVLWETSLPVYAIGGIHPYNIEEIRAVGAQGVCFMSEAMKF